MPLKITLKTNERIFIGGAVIKNIGGKTNLSIENKAAVLREKEILKPEDANTPGKRIYFIIQMMYIDRENLPEHHKTYWKRVSEYLSAAPSALNQVEKISRLLLKENYYQGLKEAKKLMAYEKEVMHHAGC